MRVYLAAAAALLLQRADALTFPKFELRKPPPAPAPAPQKKLSLFGPTIRKAQIADLEPLAETRLQASPFAAGHAIALESDGAGALSIRVTNPGGLVHSQQLTKGPASVFLQQNDFNLGFSLCDLSNKYKQAIYGVEDDELEGWMPTEHSPYFAFETKYTKASKRLMTAKTSLTLATAGCALDGKAFEASSFVDALEAVEAQC